MEPKKNIILTGFMGCGKTTLGIRLSYRLRLPLTDTDKWIEKEQEKSISDIFAADGETAFRRMETQALKDIGKDGVRQVIATGGGLPLSEENRALLKGLGHVVYLRVQPETVFERLKGDTTRPLLRKSDPESEICKLLAQRDPLYTAGADVIVDVDGKDCEQIIEDILGQISEREAE